MLKITTFLVLLFFLTSVAFGQSYNDQVARWNSLTSSANALAQLQEIEQWDVAANFRPSVFQELLKHYEGTRVVANTGFGKKVGLFAVIDDISFGTESGIVAGEIAITAATKRPSLRFSFHGRAELEFSRFEDVDDEPEELEAVFVYRVSDVRPNYSFWQRIRRMFGGFVDKVTAEVGEMITKRLSDGGALEVRVRLPKTLELPLEVDEQDVIDFKDDDRVIGTVNYRLSAPKNIVRRKLNFIPPIISSSGISVFATLRSANPSAKDVAPPSVPSVDEIDAKISSLISKIDGAEIFELNQDDAYEIRIAASVGSSLVSELAALPNEQRAVQLRTESANGLLLDLRGRDDNFGKFGIKGHSQGRETLKATGQLASLDSRIYEDGLTLTASATANALASAKLVWDGFLIKSALSFDISLQGNAAADIRAPLRMVTHSKAGLTGVLWGLDFQCTTFAANVSTSAGELFGIIPVIYSEIRATVPITIFEDANTADLVLSSRPSRLLKVPFVSEEEQKKQDYLIEADTNFVEYRLVPGFAGYAGGHYLMRGTISSIAKKIDLRKEGEEFFVGASKLGGDWFTDEERKSFDEAESELSKYEFSRKAACPEGPAPRLEVLGLNFGPEGEVVKFITAGFTSEEQKLEAYKSLLKGDPKGAGEHLVGSLEAQVELTEAAISAAKKALKKGTKIPKKPEDIPLEPGVPGSPTIKDLGNAVDKLGKKIFSDVRLKAEISKVGDLSEGIGLYRFRYVGHRQFYVGVLAQEVLLHKPDAVSMTDTGYLAVDYGALGTEFRSWEVWNKE